MHMFSLARSTCEVCNLSHVQFCSPTLWDMEKQVKMLPLQLGCRTCTSGIILLQPRALVGLRSDE